MGEALIARRGGSVKRGRVSTVGDFRDGKYGSISDPNLVNVRNGIIFLNWSGGFSTQSSGNVVTTVVIENGVLSKVIALAHVNTDGSSDVTNSCEYAPSEGKIKATYNLATGFFTSNKDTLLSAYDYIIFD